MLNTQIKTIVAIMDMDGFVVNKKFHCKELALMRVGDDTAKSFFFDINLKETDLSPKDRRTCRYVQEHIHKLPFDVPPHTEAIKISDLEVIVENFYQETKVNINSAIAYKGGHFERDLLASLNIPSFNLEYLGCPKAEKLFDQLIWIETCGKHLTSNAHWHCPKVEVEAFGHWLETFGLLMAI